MVRSAEARSIARATTTRTRRVSAAVTPSEGVSSEAARGTPRRARREVGERRRGRRARGAGGARRRVDQPPRAFERQAHDRGGGRREPRRGLQLRDGRGTREGRAIDAAIESIGAARATVAIDAAIGAPRRRKDGRARGEVWQPGLPWDGTSRVRGISTRLSSAREAHQKAARGAASVLPRVSRNARQLSSAPPKRREFNTAGSTTFERRDAAATSPDASAVSSTRFGVHARRAPLGPPRANLRFRPRRVSPRIEIALHIT